MMMVIIMIWLVSALAFTMTITLKSKRTVLWWRGWLFLSGMFLIGFLPLMFSWSIERDPLWCETNPVIQFLGPWTWTLEPYFPGLAWLRDADHTQGVVFRCAPEMALLGVMLGFVYIGFIIKDLVCEWDARMEWAENCFRTYSWLSLAGFFVVGLVMFAFAAYMIWAVGGGYKPKVGWRGPLLSWGSIYAWFAFGGAGEVFFLSWIIWRWKRWRSGRASGVGKPGVAGSDLTQTDQGR